MGRQPRSLGPTTRTSRKSRAAWADEVQEEEEDDRVLEDDDEEIDEDLAFSAEDYRKYGDVGGKRKVRRRLQVGL